MDVLAVSVPADDVLTVFLALRRERINRKHACRFILQYILNHPCLEDLALNRRPAVVHCIEHAVGRNVARGCARNIQNGRGDTYVNRNLLRFATDRERAAAVFRYLFMPGTSLAVVGRESYANHHTQSESLAKREQDCPKTVTATNRGDIAATLVHLYRGGDSTELTRALDTYADHAAAQMPKFDGSVSLVLDVSESTRGYGDREFCCVSQSVALKLVLQRCCRQLNVHQVGGVDDPPMPEGSTDLAGAVLDALADEPDVVAIVSDGYENVCDADLRRVIASLPAIGEDTPIVFCHSKFSSKDSLECRRPAPALPELEFWHEQDFDHVLYFLFSIAKGRVGGNFIREQMTAVLEQRETEVARWTETK
jgi:hypothetical protein